MSDLKVELIKRYGQRPWLMDLADKYAELQSVADALDRDLVTRGVQIPGMHGPRLNPSLKSLWKINNQMLNMMAFFKLATNND